MSDGGNWQFFSDVSLLMWKAFSCQIRCTFGGLKTICSSLPVQVFLSLALWPLEWAQTRSATLTHSCLLASGQHFKSHFLWDGWFCCHWCLSATTVGICCIICYTLAGRSKWKQKWKTSRQSPDRQPCREFVLQNPSIRRVIIDYILWEN